MLIPGVWLKVIQLLLMSTKFSGNVSLELIEGIGVGENSSFTRQKRSLTKPEYFEGFIFRGETNPNEISILLNWTVSLWQLKWHHVHILCKSCGFENGESRVVTFDPRPRSKSLLLTGPQFEPNQYFEIKLWMKNIENEERSGVVSTTIDTEECTEDQGSDSEDEKPLSDIKQSTILSRFLTPDSTENSSC